MSKIDLEELFFDFSEVLERFIPEADQVEMFAEILRSLEDKGHDIHVLYGHNEVVDEAFDEISSENDDTDEDIDDEDY